MRNKGFIFFLLGIAVVIALSIIFIGRDSTDDQTSCKDTSTTVGSYRLCLALEKCHDDFRDNSALRQDCLFNVSYQAMNSILND